MLITAWGPLNCHHASCHYYLHCKIGDSLTLVDELKPVDLFYKICLTVINCVIVVIKINICFIFTASPPLINPPSPSTVENLILIGNFLHNIRTCRYRLLYQEKLYNTI